MGKILITGANGLVGYALRSLHLYDVCYLSHNDVDLTNFEQTKVLFNYIKPEKVIHLAATVGGIGGNAAHSGEFFRSNVMINLNVLECAKLVKVKKLVSFMSTCIFPDKCNYPLNERDLHNGAPHASNFGYAYAKRMLEVQSQAYRKEWNCNFITVIPTNIYGSNDNFNLIEGHVIPSLIHKCYLAKENNTDLVIWGTGNPLREFIYSIDIARLTIWALNYYEDENPIILTNGIEISIKDVVNIIVQKMNFKGKVIFDTSKPDGQFRKPSDNSKLNCLYPTFSFTPLNDGLEKTIKWFIDNYPNIRL